MKKVKKLKKYMQVDNALEVLRTAAAYKYSNGLQNNDKKSVKIINAVLNCLGSFLSKNEVIVELRFRGDPDSEVIAVYTCVPEMSARDVTYTYTFPVETMRLALEKIRVQHELKMLEEQLNDERHDVSLIQGY